jgi:DNA-binding winged helix-turn-helix (wHTH) protein
VNEPAHIYFPPFRFDIGNDQLWRDTAVLSLRPQALRVLRYLLMHPHQLLTKDELLGRCWPQATVSDTVLKVCIREIREALDDDIQSPRFIQTAHRRGYRFIGTIITEPGAENDADEKVKLPATAVLLMTVHTLQAENEALRASQAATQQALQLMQLRLGRLEQSFLVQQAA